MADLYASRAPVRLNDGSADANNAVITNTTPGGSDYALVVRPIPSGTQTVDTELPVAAALTDNFATPTAPAVGAFAMAYDGSTWDMVRGSAADGLLVNLGTNNDVVVSGSVTADTELPVAAAISADAQSAPTAPGVYGWLMGFNGTNWDRVRVANTGRLQVDVVTGGGSNASIFADNAAFTPDTSSITVVGMLFDDAAGAALTENDVAAARIDSKRAQMFVGEDATTRGQKWAISAAGALAGNITQIGGAAPGATVFLPVRPTDGSAYLTRLGQTQATAQYASVSDGTTVAGVIVGTAALKTDLASIAGTATVTGGVAGTLGIGGVLAHDAAATAALPVGVGFFASAASPSAVSADGDAVKGWALRNGSLVVNLASGGTLVTVGQKVMASSLPVAIASDQGALSVEAAELPTSATLADATANPSLSAISGYLMGYNGTTWDRVRTANTGRLQVDVVTGGGSAPASEVPTGYNLLSVYGSTSGTAAGATPVVCTNTPANLKVVYIKSVLVAASGQTKWQLKFGATVLATGFNSQTTLGLTHRFDPPLTITGDGATALTLDVTNRESSAMDLYARYGAIVQQ